jgi:hypothetical protein
MRLWGEEEGGRGVGAFIPKIVDMPLIRRARALTGRNSRTPFQFGYFLAIQFDRSKHTRPVRRQALRGAIRRANV